MAWYGIIISKVEERIFHLLVKISISTTKLILQYKKVLDFLNELHEKFDAAHTEKASKTYFLKLTYLVITPTYTIFQINMLVMSFLIISILQTSRITNTARVSANASFM